MTPRTPLPANERAQLQAIAPIVTSIAQAQSLPNAPLSFSGRTDRTGFYDQNNRLIVTITNPSTADTATAISGTMTLNTLASGNYVATDLIAGTTIPFTVTNGKAGRTRHPSALGYHGPRHHPGKLNTKPDHPLHNNRAGDRGLPLIF